MKDEGLIKRLTELIEPIVTGLGYELYHLEKVKEGGENYLRVYIDKEEGISLNDCVVVNKEIGKILDEKDPIPDFYYLEISSPGIDRVLHNDKHIQRYIGFTVVIKLESLLNGKKKFEGTLEGSDKGEILVKCGEEIISIPREKISIIRLKGEY